MPVITPTLTAQRSEFEYNGSGFNEQTSGELYAYNSGPGIQASAIRFNPFSLPPGSTINAITLEIFAVAASGTPAQADIGFANNDGNLASQNLHTASNAPASIHGSGFSSPPAGSVLVADTTAASYEIDLTDSYVEANAETDVVILLNGLTAGGSPSYGFTVDGIGDTNPPVLTVDYSVEEITYDLEISGLTGYERIFLSKPNPGPLDIVQVIEIPTETDMVEVNIDGPRIITATGLTTNVTSLKGVLHDPVADGLTLDLSGGV